MARYQALVHLYCGTAEWEGVTAPPPQNVPGLKERNISEGWLPADDPAASTMAL